MRNAQIKSLLAQNQCLDALIEFKLIARINKRTKVIETLENHRKLKLPF